MQYYQAWGLEHKDAALVWRFVKDIAGSGSLGDLGCHALDLCEFVTGEEYDKVFAHNGTFVHERRLLEGEGKGKVDVDDYSNIFVETKSGASFSFEISRFNYGRGNYQRMEIYGEKGAIVYHLDRIPGVDEIEICDETTGDKYVPLEIPEEFKVDQMQSFADIVNGCEDGLSATIEDGLRSQILLDAILEAAEKGTWVKL
ncbi:MAG: Gfo/Idh/MocA family oxidoreductase [Clostridia bacterium]|nr:Gfo/Idh/MocA family oxidoreductase [Clostridia bacterium]